MTATTHPPSEMEILRRIVDSEQVEFSKEAAKAVLRLDFSKADRTRMNELAVKNREATISALELQELDSYIRVGQTLGVLQSKARRALRKVGKSNGLGT